MGCGCGRKTGGRAARIKSQTTKTLKNRKIMLHRSLNKMATISPILSNRAICLSCIESKQSKDEIKKGIRVCHKTNRLINNLFRDPRSVCPLGKWKKTK
jgi:hypothetical protein